MIKTIVFSLVAGIGGLFIATKFFPGVAFSGSLTTLLLVGAILGVVIAVIRPLLELVSLLLRILALGAISIAIVWVLKLIFPQLIIAGVLPLVYTGAIVAGIAIILSLIE